MQLSDGRHRHYDVALHFADIEAAAPGERLFNVKIQGKNVLSRLDIAAAAGGANRALVKKMPNTEANGTMSIELVPVAGHVPLICSVEIIERK